MPERINQAHLDMLKEVIGDDLKEILQTFIQTAPQTVAQMEAAMNSGSTENLRLHAHTLKGSSANVGATRLSDLSLLVENRAKVGEMNEARPHVETILAETDAVLSFLQDYMDSF